MECREEENVHLVHELLLSSLGAGRRTCGSLSWPGLLPTRGQAHQEHGRQTTICPQGTDEGSLPSAKGASEPLLKDKQGSGRRGGRKAIPSRGEGMSKGQRLTPRSGDQRGVAPRESSCSTCKRVPGRGPGSGDMGRVGPVSLLKKKK